jgi:hypothetical protein
LECRITLPLDKRGAACRMIQSARPARLALAYARQSVTLRSKNTCGKFNKEGCEKMLELEPIKYELDDEAEKLRELGESL